MEDQVEVSAIEVLPVDALAHCFLSLSSFKDLAQQSIPLPIAEFNYGSCFVDLIDCRARVSIVCRKWREAVKQSLARRDKLSFAGWKMDDNSLARLVHGAFGLKELDISRGCWGCRITDDGLYKISLAKCCINLTSVSMWGITGITDNGVIQLVSRARSLQHLNIGGTFITDDSLFVIASHCPQLKVLILWGCRHVTERGLFALIRGCPKLESINVWGMRVSLECYVSLLTIKPHLLIKPGGVHLHAGRVPQWPIVQ